ncbi:peptide chain release factor N(5)-glutamine methyltransferase [Maribacter litopenaei]|uniref:peptide chain release factor N(5)-glutamine methyltransferase n=1 Tax=Maribacter litopenaei TaxID=2976127 RepID=A0ABY5Y3S3_9FLAO|nr:peptide chain release factor N(5)-glutamine methyltransferase [Maribacter litopenaei]UWX53637.1 peptide chain release factor N(5)-glutamine methyltransferase [Maribacter litopenaei]
MLLKEVKKIFHEELDPIYGKEEVSSFFYLLIEHFLGLERFVLAIQPNLMVEKKEESQLFSALSDLKLHRPIQHVIGSAHFMDMEFKVGPEVLIPRPETEELVRWILEDFEKRIGLDVLDMGTGSGCIAISLSKFLNKANVKAIDISMEALKIAQDNAKKNMVQVDFFKADISNLNIEQKFDIIISNPPYVRELEKNNMTNNVLSFEPEGALFVSDKDPLIFYRHIADFASQNLKTNGILYLEINQYLGPETCDLLSMFNFNSIELRKDMYGNDRMIKAKM